MFTGIIEDIGKVKSLEKRGKTAKITIASSFGKAQHLFPAPTLVKKPIRMAEIGAWQGELKPGDSVSVDGACLTVVGLKKGEFSADVSEETLKRTTLGSLGAGASVNLERPLTALKPLGGHIVTGHIDCVGSITAKNLLNDYAEIEFKLPAGFLRFIVPKGSVAVDGISITVMELTRQGFKAAVIPHTLKSTTLSLKEVGEKVNIETDIIAKYVERFLNPPRPPFFKGGRQRGITEPFLKKHGFLP